MSWWNDRRMLRYIWRELDMRFQSKYQQAQVSKTLRSKTIIDLALDSYLAETSQDNSSQTMDTTFRDFATSQIRTFVFAGHDSTSSTMCYVFHLLSINPKSRTLVIEELDSVLGPDAKSTAEQITSNPRLLNQLSYTLAVIKEALRLYPPASSTRSGEPSYSIPTPNGLRLPTDGFLVWSNHYTLQRNPLYWPEPNTFLPERWLVEEGHRLYPVKGAYRPFEFGARNCIGQELAMLELKLVLVMTVREFVVRSVYEEWDEMNPKIRKGTRLLDGDRAYQVLNGAAHPCDGLPCRVEMVW